MYESENHNIEKALQIIKEKSLDHRALWEAYGQLASHYQTLLGDIKFLANISDRLQNKLVSAHENLKVKTDSLEQANKINVEQYKELNRIKLTLEDKVEERTRELQYSNEELVAINTELDNFVYRASHDIRGPIARLIGLCNIATLEVKDEVGLKYFNMIQHNAQHLNDILARLLNTNTLKNSQINLEEVCVSKAIEKAKFAVSSLEGFDLIQTNINVNEDLTFYTDFNVIVILLESLLEHAIKNNITDSREEAHVGLQVIEQSKNLQIYMVYSGVEIPMNHVPSIFDMFHRISNNEGVSGMELYTAQLAASKLSGKLEFISSSPTETIFSVFLPAIASENPLK